VPALRQPAIQPWLPLYVEACLLAGRRAETEEALAALDETLVEPLPGPFATAARVRAALRSSDGDHRGAVSVLTDAIARIEAMDKPAHPFEQAAVHLALGSSLRRAGRRRMAVDALSTAREAMAALGARPWLDTCDRELATCGVSTHHDGRGRRIELTAQELAVARLAAQGLSNRQIAAELIVSVKTIEYHLGNIYPKLGIRSRAAVATALADLSS
jgi:ATP/maltotriose-dependent transcriptional regulator MalT